MPSPSAIHPTDDDDAGPPPGAEPAAESLAAEPLAAGTEVELPVDADAVGMRLDLFLVRMVPGLSRSYLARAIDKGGVRIDGVVARGSLKLKPGAVVRFTVPEPPRAGPVAEEIPLTFIHLDETIAAVDKPAGMVVHPAKGNWKGTLAGALKWHLERHDAGGAGLSTAGGPTRPGIVHRLDRETSGVIVVARTEAAHHALARQFERRTVEKTYLAITQAAPRFDRDEIVLPIGIHPYQREKMAVRRDHPTSREAVTVYEVLERFPARSGRGTAAALVRITPRTGRTHQIRVHLAAIGCPVLCDGLYSGRTVIEPAFVGLPPGPPLLARQALHAARLAIDHPATGGRLVLEAALPPDMETMLAALRRT